jgi:hypothetical protein
MVKYGNLTTKNKIIKNITNDKIKKLSKLTDC